MENSHYFKYGEQALSHLKSKDKQLCEIIDKVGMIKRPVIPDIYQALVNSVIGQQISTKAHKTIWKRLKDSIDMITPVSISQLTDEELQAIGLSFKKVGYIKNITNKVITGELDLKRLQQMNDEDVCNELVKLKGIGQWTAEMIMIFSMQRPNILSYGDLAILRGMRMLYHHRKITEKLFNKYRRRYTPYASVASLYLWKIASGEFPGMKDYGKR